MIKSYIFFVLFGAFLSLLILCIFCIFLCNCSVPYSYRNTHIIIFRTVRCRFSLAQLQDLWLLSERLINTFVNFLSLFNMPSDYGIRPNIFSFFPFAIFLFLYIISPVLLFSPFVYGKNNSWIKDKKISFVLFFYNVCHIPDGDEFTAHAIVAII